MGQTHPPPLPLFEATSPAATRLSASRRAAFPSLALSGMPATASRATPRLGGRPESWVGTTPRVVSGFSLRHHSARPSSQRRSLVTPTRLYLLSPLVPRLQLSPRSRMATGSLSRV